MHHKLHLLPIFLLITLLVNLSSSLPLSTSSRWIVDDETGSRLKLTCVNWAAHLEPMLAEGLDKKPVRDIVNQVAKMGFNCVRLTWATYMFTRFSNTTVSETFSNLGLHDAMEGLIKNNPEFVDLTVVDAQRALIDELGKQGVMVVLDNQVSQPMWCCGDRDGNGFFGDRFFDAKEWLHGLSDVAKRYIDTPTVVAMSMRNELRGPLQNETIWYKNVQRAAKEIHKANPNLLVIVSGLHYDLDFTFLRNTSLNLSFKNKLVFETHRYSFTSGQSKLWLDQPFDKACDSVTQEIHNQSGFLIEGESVNSAPLFVSEFGINQMGENRADELFLGCFLGYLANRDLDWSVWALQGSYYLRDGLHGPGETFGMLDSNWNGLRSPGFHQRLQLIQRKIQDPNSKSPSYYILYHPSTGRCMQVINSSLQASDCSSFSKWNYYQLENGKSNIQLVGTDGLCVSSSGDNTAASLSSDCTSTKSQWEFISNSKFQLANKDEQGRYSCLELDSYSSSSSSSSRIITKKCTCFEEDGSEDSCQEKLMGQWFQLVLANV